MTRVVTFTPNPAIDISTSIDKIVPTRKLRCAAAQRDPGGGGINVARVISRLGGDVTALYPIGGATGQLLHRLIDQEGIHTITVAVKEETREDFTVHEEMSGAQYRFVLPGPCFSDYEWQSCLDALAAIEGGAGFVVASGSLPRGVPDDFYARSARQATNSGAKFVLDSSGPPLAAAMNEGVYLVKPSRGELGGLVGEALQNEVQYVSAARSLVKAGKAEIVALTLGHEGALLVTRDGALRAPPLAVKVVSTVGAGDSFLGAMVWSLARGDEIRDAFRYGVAAGSAALLSPGTQLCSVADVHELYGRVVIEVV
jgi:6-phosphofructokinase 2